MVTLRQIVGIRNPHFNKGEEEAGKPGILHTPKFHLLYDEKF
jgi:hypothetical protein